MHKWFLSNDSHKALLASRKSLADSHQNLSQNKLDLVWNSQFVLCSHSSSMLFSMRWRNQWISNIRMRNHRRTVTQCIAWLNSSLSQPIIPVKYFDSVITILRWYLLCFEDMSVDWIMHVEIQRMKRNLHLGVKMLWFSLSLQLLLSDSRMWNSSSNSMLILSNR